MPNGHRTKRLEAGGVAVLLTAFILCSLIVGIAAHSAGRQSEQQHQQTIAASESGSDHQQRPQQHDRNHAPVPAFAERILSNAEPTDAAEREQRDLATQENTAAWAFWIVVLTFGQLVLSGFGVAALLVTIRQGRDGLERAGEANAIAREGVRAWLNLTIDNPGPLQIQQGDPARISARLEVRLENFGDSPALDIRANMLVFLVAPLDHEWACERMKEKLERSRLDGLFKAIFPGQSETVSNLHYGTAPVTGDGGTHINAPFIMVIDVRYKSPGYGGFGFTIRGYRVELIGHNREYGIDYRLSDAHLYHTT